MIRALAPALLLLTAAAPPAPSPEYDRALAAGYKALTYCSAIFNAGRTPAQIDAEELHGIYPEYAAIVPTLTATVEQRRYTARVTVRFDPNLPPRTAVWQRYEGCTLAPIGSLPELYDLEFRAAPPPLFHPRPAAWPAGDAHIAPTPSMALLSVVERGFDRTSFGAGAETTGIVVLRDGTVVAECYGSGFGPFTANRTWSVAKSITGTLIGAARFDAATRAPGKSRDVLDPHLPAAIPQWQTGRGGNHDPRRAITLDNLLRMASGLHSDTAGNRSDAIYFGGTTVDEQALGWPLEARPGSRFRYANNDILLAAYALTNEGKAEHHSIYPRSFFEKLGMMHTVAETGWHGNYTSPRRSGPPRGTSPGWDSSGFRTACGRASGCFPKAG